MKKNFRGYLLQRDGFLSQQNLERRIFPVFLVETVIILAEALRLGVK